MHRRTLLRTAASLGVASALTRVTPISAQDEENDFEGLFAHGIATLPKAEEESLEAVIVGPIIDQTFVCLIHNNSEESLIVTQLTPRLEEEDTYTDVFIAPFTVPAGGYALASVYIDGPIDDGAILQLDLTTEPAEGSFQIDFWGYREATITELSIKDNRAAGRFSNDSDGDFSGNTTILIVFLNTDDEIVGFVSEYAQTRDLPMGESGEFDLRVLNGESSDRYLAVAQGKVG